MKVFASTVEARSCLRRVLAFAQLGARFGKNGWLKLTCAAEGHQFVIVELDANALPSPAESAFVNAHNTAHAAPGSFGLSADLFRHGELQLDGHASGDGQGRGKINAAARDVQGLSFLFVPGGIQNGSEVNRKMNIHPRREATVGCFRNHGCSSGLGGGTAGSS